MALRNLCLSISSEVLYVEGVTEFKMWVMVWVMWLLNLYTKHGHGIITSINPSEISLGFSYVYRKNPAPVGC